MPVDPAVVAAIVIGSAVVAALVGVLVYSHSDGLPEYTQPTPAETGRWEHVGVTDTDATTAWLAVLHQPEPEPEPEPEPGTDGWWTAELADDGPLAQRLDALVAGFQSKLDRKLTRKLGAKKAREWTALIADAARVDSEFRRLVERVATDTQELPVVRPRVLVGGRA